ncbi:MAG: tetratricopeptide repeat protein [Elusimicrobiota bacterium]
MSPIKQPRTTCAILAVIFLALGFQPCVVWGAERAEEVLQKALVKESGERDLEAAVQFYQQVIEAPGAGPRLVSKARLRMAGCYERLGKTKEAEQLYSQILASKPAAPTEIAHEAQVNLRRIQAEYQKAQLEVAAKKQMVMVRQFRGTKATLQLGPATMLPQTNSSFKLSVAIRYRIAPFLYLEGGVLPSLEGEKAQEALPASNDSTTKASLVFRYQTTLALMGELPHGKQRMLVPEIGGGVALTSSKIQYICVPTGSTQASGEIIQKTWSPLFSAGLHLYPDRLVSVVLQSRYAANPYPQSVAIPELSRRAAFDFPSGLWTFTAQLQIKIGWSHVVLRPKI